MTSFRRSLFRLAALVTGVLMCAIPTALAQGVPGTGANKCLAGKTKCVNLKTAGVLKCREKCQASPKKCGQAQTDCENKVITKFEGCFAKVESKANPAKPVSVCTTTGDTAAMEARVDVFVGTVVAALEGNPLPGPGQAFLASGQTTCWNAAGGVIPCAGTGQDGEVRTGIALSYTDNGDGTVTDNNTGLVWEKKSDDGTINDKDATYTWAQAFSGHVASLNAAAFAGHTDWRVPNVRELQSILNYQNLSPAVSPAFNAGCTPGCTVTTCSCTQASIHWSSTTVVDFPSDAWGVNWFFAGALNGSNKSGANNSVRAVRGGL